VARMAVFRVIQHDQLGAALAFALDVDGVDVAEQLGTAILDRLAAVPPGEAITYEAQVYPIANLGETIPAPTPPA
jgi:hypothetical protein